MRSHYRDLVAYQLALQLAEAVHASTRDWPKFERWALGLQLVRATDSIAANIAESAGRWSKAERRRMLIDARGSLYETEHWLNRAERQNLPLNDAQTFTDELARTLAGLIKRHA